MRILMLAQFYPPVVGGEEHHVQALATELASRGHRVSVATLAQHGEPDFAVDQGVRIYRINGLAQRLPALFAESGRRHVPPFPDPALVLALRRILAVEQPQIVHAHNWLVHSFLPLKSRSGASLVMSLHDYSLVCAVKSAVYRGRPCPGPGLGCLGHSVDHYGLLKGVPVAMGNWAMSAVERSSVDIFVAVSQAVVEGNRLAGEKTPYRVIPNFLSDEPPAPGDWSSYLARLPGEPFLLFVGDLRTFKGIDVLLQAYAGLTPGREGKVPPLVLIGRVLDETPKEFPPNVLVLGKWPHDAVLAALDRSLATVMPSIGPETFGIAALEAAASGRPVIASRIGGLPDVVEDGKGGFLVPPGDAGALRDALQRMVDEPELALRMGVVAKAGAERFQARNVVPRFERMYEELLGNQRLQLRQK